MKKLTAIAAVFAASAALSGQAYAIGASAGVFNVQGNSTGASVSASGTVNLTYIPLHDEDFDFSGQWSFVDQGGGAVDFNGNMAFEDYQTFTTVSVTFFGSMNGTVTVLGSEQTIGTDVSGPQGSWDPDTLTFTFHVPNAGGNTSGASNYTEVESSCTGSGSVLGNTVCGTRGNTTPEWEGLTISLVFASDLKSFTGTITAVEASGSGLTANVTTLTYSVSGTEIPIPAAAWLFGTGLVGLAGVARRRQSLKAAA